MFEQARQSYTATHTRCSANRVQDGVHLLTAQHLRNVAATGLSPPAVSWTSSAIKPYIQEFRSSYARHSVMHDHHRWNAGRSPAAPRSPDLSHMPFLRSQLMLESQRAGISENRSTEHTDISNDTGYCLVKEELPENKVQEGWLVSEQSTLSQAQQCDMPGRIQILNGEDAATAATKFLHLTATEPNTRDRKTPADPERLQSSLHVLKPMIVYVQYSCAQDCRSMGICVHFSFLLGGRRCPDGLICACCFEVQNEKGYFTKRLCTTHNRRSSSQFVSNLIEDWPATKNQVERATELLRRALTCDWEQSPSSDRTCDNIAREGYDAYHEVIKHDDALTLCEPAESEDLMRPLNGVRAYHNRGRQTKSINEAENEPWTLTFGGVGEVGHHAAEIDRNDLILENVQLSSSCEEDHSAPMTDSLRVSPSADVVLHEWSPDGNLDALWAQAIKT